MNVIKLVQEAGMRWEGGFTRVIECVTEAELTRFAYLVRNAALEECASEFEGQYTDSCPSTNISAAIRAMKENGND